MGEGVRECVCRPMAGPYIGTLNANMMDEAKGEGADSKRVKQERASTNDVRTRAEGDEVRWVKGESDEVREVV